jgi:hypothetical protein
MSALPSAVMYYRYRYNTIMYYQLPYNDTQYREMSDLHFHILLISVHYLTLINTATVKKKGSLLFVPVVSDESMESVGHRNPANQAAAVGQPS